jgi:putative oxidoreductase
LFVARFLQIQLKTLSIMQANIINEKTNNHTYPRWLTFLRIAVGLVLIAKGISFFHDSTTIEKIIHYRGWGIFENNVQTTAALITYITLLGGVFIATGLFTRWISIIQIPLLIGAVIFNVQEGISFSNTEFLLSAMTLFVLCVLVVKGSGPISADEFFRNYTFAGMERGHTNKFFQ